MAVLTPGLDVSKRLDERYAQIQESRTAERSASQNAIAQQSDADRRARQDLQTQATRATDDVRRLDAEQRLRDQQLTADLRRIEQNRQNAAEDAIQAALQQAALAEAANAQSTRAAENPNRGVIVDLYA